MPLPRLTLGDCRELLSRHGLLAGETGGPDSAARVSLVSCDSRVVVPGTLFLCKGAAFREEFLLTAERLGAAAYVSERPYDGAGIPALLVSDIRRAMALLADAFYAHPSGEVPVVGITGTKGKTTTAFFLRSILDTWRSAAPCALLSTILTDDGVERFPSALTTPEPLELQRHLSNARESGRSAVVMEVSSQALKYHRTLGVDFACGVFLNIGEDHISPIEHPDFEDYFSSKLALFSQSRAAVCNLDCDHAQRIAAAAAVCPRVLTFSLREERADVFALSVTPGEKGTAVRVRTPDWTGELLVPLPGLFNVENALAAVAVCSLLGVPEDAVREGLARAGVPGRMEVLRSTDDQLIAVVDYSHNGMSLSAALGALREEYPGRELTVVFGCTGGKALDRRAGMAEAAARFADRILLTEDDPGPESVESICADIGAHLEAHGRTDYAVIPDREEAVAAALLRSKAPAVVLLAGKGAERRQKRAEGDVPCIPDADLAGEVLARYDRGGFL